MARLGPAIHVLVEAQESTTVKLQNLTGIGLMGHIKSRYASACRFTPRLYPVERVEGVNLAGDKAEIADEQVAAERPETG
jgi:hypothetical protein